MGFRLTEGQQVIAKGSVSVFERDGRYQLYVKEVTLDGAGALLNALIVVCGNDHFRKAADQISFVVQNGATAA